MHFFIIEAFLTTLEAVLNNCALPFSAEGTSPLILSSGWCFILYTQAHLVGISIIFEPLA